jgi:hypothetical protein
MTGNQSVYTAIAAIRIIGRTPETVADLYHALYYRSRRRWILRNMPQYYPRHDSDADRHRRDTWQDTVLRHWCDNNRVIL